MINSTEQTQARNEILAVLTLLLGDNSGPAKPETLETLYSLAIATREYLEAENQAEALENAADTLLASPDESNGPVKDWTYSEIARYLRERGKVLEVWCERNGDWTARLKPVGGAWRYRASREPSFQDAIMAVLDMATGRRDPNTWREPGKD